MRQFPDIMHEAIHLPLPIHLGSAPQLSPLLQRRFPNAGSTVAKRTAQSRPLAYSRIPAGHTQCEPSSGIRNSAGVNSGGLVCCARLSHSGSGFAACCADHPGACAALIRNGVARGRAIVCVEKPPQGGIDIRMIDDVNMTHSGKNPAAGKGNPPRPLPRLARSTGQAHQQVSQQPAYRVCRVF